MRSRQEVIVLRIDRGWPIRHQYRQHELIIKLNWKSPYVDVPESAVVLCESEKPRRIFVVLKLNGPWSNVDQAMSEVILAAELWVDCQ